MTMLGTSTAGTTAAGAKGRSGLHPALVGLIVAAVAAGGGYLLWKTWTSAGAKRAGGLVVATDEPPSAYRQTAWQNRMRVQAMSAMNAPDYVRERGRGQGGGWEVKGNRTRLLIQRGGNDRLRLTAESLDPNFITAEQRTLLNLRARGGGEDAVARHLELTAEQREQLNRIPRGWNYTIDEPTRQRLTELFRAWESAPEAERQPHAQALIAAVRELESAQAEATRRAVAQRAEQIRSIVTPQQVRLFEEMGRAGGGPGGPGGGPGGPGGGPGGAGGR